MALYRLLNNRGAHTPDELQRFILQTVWCLFASSLGMLPGQPVRKIVASLRADVSGQRSSAAELGHLYTLLGKRTLVALAEAAWCPSDLVVVVATDLDWHLGVLMS